MEHLKREQPLNYLKMPQNVPCAACTIKLDKEPIIEYLNSNIVLLKYRNQLKVMADARTLERRIRIQQWLDNYDY